MTSRLTSNQKTLDQSWDWDAISTHMEISPEQLAREESAAELRDRMRQPKRERGYDAVREHGTLHKGAGGVL